MTTKSIDLGALQEGLRNAEALIKSRARILEAARARCESAQRAVEKSVSSHREAVEAREQAKRALIEGARQVANG